VIRIRVLNLVLISIFWSGIVSGQEVAKDTIVNFEALPEGVASFGATTLTRLLQFEK